MTPLETVIHAIQSITWGQVWGGVVFVLGSVVTMTLKAAKTKARLATTEAHVEKMATNDMPHTFHTLLNIDKNIAKMSGGDVVDFTELNVNLAAKKNLK